MRCLAVIAFASTSCGSSPPPAPVTSTAAPTAAAPSTPIGAAPQTIAAEPIADLQAPAFGRVTAMFHVDDRIAVTIDEAGHAQHTGNPLFLGPTAHALPFSEPVDDVVYLRQFAHPHDIPGAQLGRMFCARTRTAVVECVLDFEATPRAPRFARRFRLPVEGGVRQLGVFVPWQPGGPDRVLCAMGTTPSCWSFDGEHATRYTLDAANAEAAALRIQPASIVAWRAAAPQITADHVREIVRSEGQDVAHLVGGEASIAVQCARLADGALDCFGYGVYGELGDGKLAVTARTSRPLGAASVIDVAMGSHHACAVVADGRVACWGRLPADLPVPRHKTTGVPACRLDRAASAAKFAADRNAAIQRAQECARGCDKRGRDGCLGCVVGCTAVPYVFPHDEICQEPLGLAGTLASKGLACFDAQATPHWLSDAELRNDVPPVTLTLAPVFLSNITDAVGVALPGRPSLCVLRKTGVIACLDDRGKLSPRP